MFEMLSEVGFGNTFANGISLDETFLGRGRVRKLRGELVRNAYTEEWTLLL